MALNISPNGLIYIPKWNDNKECEPAEQIRCKYSTLTMRDIVTIGNETGINLLSGVSFVHSDPEILAKHWDLMKYVLEKYTTDYENVLIGGEAITTGDGIAEKLPAKESGLAMEVFAFVVNESLGTGGQAKNSEAESEPENSGSASTADSAS